MAAPLRSPRPLAGRFRDRFHEPWSADHYIRPESKSAPESHRIACP